MKSLEKFLLDYLGKSKGYPTDKEYLGECLSICKLYIKECFGINPPPSGTNSAYGYWSNFPNPLGEKFEKVLNTDDLIPEKGWIAIWKPWASNPYGHIAIVADGCTTGTLKNYAQNWTSKIFQLESNRYTNVIGFLKPKSIISDMTDEQKKLLTIIKENGLSEGDLRWVTDLKKNQTVSNLEKKVEDLEKDLSSVQSKLSEIEAKFIDNQKILSDCQKALSTANSKLDKLNQIIDELTKDRDDWRGRYNNKNTEYNDLTTNFNDLSKLFEEYKKHYPQTTKPSIIEFIKSLFLKWKK